MMNQGTKRVIGADGRVCRAAADGSASRRWRSAKNSTTGPSISTRISFTSVPTWPESTLTGNAAASTCGTA